MENLKFRNLDANEIDVRVQSISPKGISLLIYKDSRCDMNILDETVGCLGWKRGHTRDNKNCTVSIWSDEVKEWITKEDAGKESFTEKEKGLASDSFKRACVNWGIGRELYSAPFIWIKPMDKEITEYNGKHTTKTKFKVGFIDYDERDNIKSLLIIDGLGRERFKFGKCAASNNKDLTIEELKVEISKAKTIEDLEILKVDNSSLMNSIHLKDICIDKYNEIVN